jgi:hypothetical protein
MRRSYILLNLSNYGIGFIVSLFLTFSYNGDASYIIFVKQTLSSMLCLLFVTLPFERAMLLKQERFSITCSNSQAVLSLVAVLASMLYVGYVTQEWVLAIGMLVFGSFSQLAIALLSAHFIASNKIVRSVFWTVASRLIDFLPITLLEFNLITTSIVAIYYSIIALGLLVLILKFIIFINREKHLVDYEIVRLLSMSLELVLTNYLLVNANESKLIFFVNSICLVFITLVMTPYWHRRHQAKGFAIVAGLLSAGVMLISPMASLAMARVMAFTCSTIHTVFIFLAPIIISGIFLGYEATLNVPMLIAIIVYALIGSLGGYSLCQMKESKNS